MPTTTDTTLRVGTVLDAGGDPHTVIIASVASRPGYAAVLALSNNPETWHRFAVWHAYPVTAERAIDGAVGWQVESGGYYRELGDALADYTDRRTGPVTAKDTDPIEPADVDR